MSKMIEAGLDNPNAPSFRSRVLRFLPLPERAKTDFVIRYIEAQIPPLYAATEVPKFLEILRGETRRLPAETFILSSRSG